MRIIVGVSGGIAAYKTGELVSRLVKAGHEVRVVMTRAAHQFMGPLTFRALSGQAVVTDAEEDAYGAIGHIALSHWGEALVIAPASANLMARLARGAADDMLSLIYLGFRGPILMAPAMEPLMWDHPRTRANVSTLMHDGVHLVGPTEGRMASGREGLGRMAEPVDIYSALMDVTTEKQLAGVAMVVTAGSTWEYFDPVRLLANPSTGLMGVLIANEGARRGAAVTLVHGPGVRESLHPQVTAYPVVSALEMLEAVELLAVRAHVVVGAAAVSDFRPREVWKRKAHKEEVGLLWEMERNPDIMGELGRRYHGEKVLVGFAAETEDPIEQAQKKRERKQLDAVVANRVGIHAGFGPDHHQAWLVSDDQVTTISPQTKEATAKTLIDWIWHRYRGE